MKKAVSIIMLTFLILLLQGCGGDASTDPNVDPDGDDSGDNGGEQNPGSLSISASNQSVLEGEELSFSVTASDPNGTSYSFVADGTSNSTNPLSLNTVNFNGSTGLFTWDTEIGDAGTYSITFSVSNNASPIETDSTTIAISVQNTIGFGQSLYMQHCSSSGCHGTPTQVGNHPLLVSTPRDVREALGIDGNAAVGAMDNVAGQLGSPTRDANAIGYYLCDVGGLDVNNTQDCTL